MVGSGPGRIVANGVSVRHGPTGKSGQVQIATAGVNLPATLSRHEATVPTAHGASGPGGQVTPESSADVPLTGARTRAAVGGRPVIDMTANARTSKAAREPVG
jgi:hypothetical protein